MKGGKVAEGGGKADAHPPKVSLEERGRGVSENPKMRDKKKGKSKTVF